MRAIAALALLPLISVVSPARSSGPRVPMTAEFTHSSSYRWLAKEVRESRLLDGMEDAATWVLEGPPEAHATMEFTAERAIEGSHALRLQSSTKTDVAGPVHGRTFGSVSARRMFGGDNWEGYNRISFHVFPDLPGFRNVSLLVRLINEGETRGRDTHYVILRNHEWNHVVWEIPDIARENVTGFAFTYRLQGNEVDATDRVTFDFDKLELQTVDADYYEGWETAPGKIAFSHTGYPAGYPKTAISGNPGAATFSLRDAQTGETVFTGGAKSVTTRTGSHALLDFSGFDRTGTYTIEAGGVRTGEFRIGSDIWKRTAEKALNFFYAERCGTAIPGVHRECHGDWQATHNGKTIIINGGWHDAGDLSQGLVNTAEAVYAMYDLAIKYRDMPDYADLRALLLEEAGWGLEWVMKTSFGDGYRINWATMDFWSNGIVGDTDDVIYEAQNIPSGNFYAAAAEAIAHRALKNIDAETAGYALRMAKMDWQFAASGTDAAGDRRESVVERASIGAIASIELYRATGETHYRDFACNMAREILSCQETSFPAGIETPITGYFYRSPAKERIVHYPHRSHEQEPIVALAGLCRAFPDHPDWMKWYYAVLLHSEYFQKAMSGFTEPFRMLPNSLYSTDEIAASREESRETVREQITGGFNTGGGTYVKAFPVQPSYQFRGNSGTMLSQAKGVSSSAGLRRNTGLIDLALEQMYWNVGKNPFAQSLMYGEGYDFAPQYTAMSGNIVGSLPVGIKSMGNRDIPYLPVTNCWNYKEVWVHPVSRWLWVLCDIGGPAVVFGAIDGAAKLPVEFRNERTGATATVNPDFTTGEYRIELPGGVYSVSCGPRQADLTVLPLEMQRLDFGGDTSLSFDCSSSAGPDGTVRISVTARGNGPHSFVLRAGNLSCDAPGQTLDLRDGAVQNAEWNCRIIDSNAPWGAVIVPDDDLAGLREFTGVPK